MIDVTSIDIDSEPMIDGIEIIGINDDGGIVTTSGAIIHIDTNAYCVIYDEYGDDMGVSSVGEVVEHFSHFKNA